MVNFSSSKIYPLYLLPFVNFAWIIDVLRASSVKFETAFESFGGIHFAGTETSEFWTGYMDGAIRSGERVAKEILSA